MARDKQQVKERIAAFGMRIDDVIHTWVWEGLTLQVKHVAGASNGQWVRIVEVSGGEDPLEFSRVFWHLDSNIQDLETWGNAAAEIRFPPEAS